VTEWDVLLKEQHEGYITWDEFEKNQHVIANNANRKGSATVKGAVRRGELLLAGLLRCGHCGRKLQVTYSGKVGRYNCHGARTNHGTERCISIGGRVTDAAASAEVLRILRPLGVDAAVKALTAQAGEISAAQRQLELALQQARYQVSHARQQYDAVDPANRLVAGELERRWNEALLAVQRIEGEIAAILAQKPTPLGESERQQLMRLGADLELAWSHPAATAATRKRILRAALNEIVVRREGAFIDVVFHWKGGDHTALQIKLTPNAAGRHHWPIPEDTLSLVRELARLMPDRQIAKLLNRVGKPTGRGNGWTEARVRSFRSYSEIAVYRKDEWAERGDVTLEAAAESLGVSKMTALRMIQRGEIKGRQPCKGAPWIIKADDLPDLGTGRSKESITPNSAQTIMQFQ
jgi:excisionase family DNA binding protein